MTAALSDRTRLVAVTAASNLIGTMPDVAAISAAAHDAGALVYVDGVHYTAHELPDVAALGADFFTCSPYKFLGPHCGVLAASPELLETIVPDKLLPATNAVPERFEFGTLPYELLAGVTAAVDVLARLATGATDAASSRRARLAVSYAALHEHEEVLRARVEAGFAELAGVTVWSRAARRTPTLLATFAGHEASDITTRLAEHRGARAERQLLRARGLAAPRPRRRGRPARRPRTVHRRRRRRTTARRARRGARLSAAGGLRTSPDGGHRRRHRVDLG